MGAEAVLAAAVPLVVATATLVWFRRGRRDEVFTGVTPGELPAVGCDPGRARVRRGAEWSGPVAVRFTPPDEVTPGLAGTVIDGRAHLVDVTATLLDLAVRGFVTLTAAPDGDGAHDWTITRTVQDPAVLMAFERDLLAHLGEPGTAVAISELRARGFDLTLRQAQIGLYREVVERGWYRKHPLAGNGRLGCLGAVVAVLAVLVVLSALGHWTSPQPWLPVLTGGLGLLVAALVVVRFGRGRTPRTAEGSAVRVQTLGFERYLTTAEAGQIRFEEAQDLFSRYLPWAIVFGVADRWARVFAEVAARAHLNGHDALFVLDWIDGVDVVTHVVGGVADVVGLANVPSGADQALVDLDLADPGAVTGLVDSMAEGLGGVVESVADFIGAAGDLVDFGDGCLDVGGCDFP